MIIKIEKTLLDLEDTRLNGKKIFGDFFFFPHEVLAIATWWFILSINMTRDMRLMYLTLNLIDYPT
jgi:hypothetical protein